MPGGAGFQPSTVGCVLWTFCSCSENDKLNMSSIYLKIAFLKDSRTRSYYAKQKEDGDS